MKKNTIKAFTLVEMLIVIVIIGILIAALLPRMNAAQWRARDVSRKTALSQIQSAIVTYQWDYGKWPWTWSWSVPTSPDSISVANIRDKLINAWMTDVPSDPLSSEVTGLWNGSASWEYLYMVSTRNGTSNAWFILMAKTEVAWGSNRVVCGTGISQWTDLATIHPCSSIEKTDACYNPNSDSGENECTYNAESQLRYIVLY